MKIILSAVLLLNLSLSYASVSSGEAIQASLINSILERLGILEEKPGARAYAGTGQPQVVNRASADVISFPLESFDEKGNMNNGAYTVGAGEAGIYNINSVVWFSSNVYKGICYLSISVNGTRISDGQVYSNYTDRLGCSVSDSLKLNDGDIVRITIYQVHPNTSHDNDPLGSRYFSIVKN